ncbi:MAG: hypothetical protein JWQ64_1467 [Subtercola sp.]|nr:hypothetical protein [Subtercola sp.]
MQPSPVQRLVAIDDIQHLKARYFRCLDAHDWSGLSALFTPDALLLVPAWHEPKGLVDALAAFAETMAAIESIHTATMPEIEVSTTDRASAIWQMTDRLYGKIGDSTEYYNLVQGFGHYAELYRKVGSQWLISELVLTRDRRDQMGPIRKIYGAATASAASPSEVESTLNDPNSARSSSTDTSSI